MKLLGAMLSSSMEGKTGTPKSQRECGAGPLKPFRSYKSFTIDLRVLLTIFCGAGSVREGRITPSEAIQFSNSLNVYNDCRKNLSSWEELPDLQDSLGLTFDAMKDP